MTELYAHLVGWLWLIAPLGIASGAFLVTKDDLGRRPRSAIVARSKARAADKLEHLAAADLDRRPWIRPYAYRAKLVSCARCVSLWLSALAAVGLVFAPEVTTVILLALALSLAATITTQATAAWLYESDDDVPPDRVEPGPDVAGVLSQLEG